ncbi:MAG: 30S ribosomal protein S5 [Candidatus Azambacteria bacterium]|nr:30S ribosomal protein S5 [Candidatus Azambacteria bacterium]
MYKKNYSFKKGAKREKSEFEQKVLDIRRVTRVVAGGKRFRFRATVVLGDHKEHVGVGVDKGADTSEAIEKASRDARKNLILVPIKNNTIPHEVIGKFSSAVVLLKPAGEGKGIVAGGPVRVIISLTGIINITSKILGTTTNKLNNARAAIEALKKLSAKGGSASGGKTSK